MVSLLCSFHVLCPFSNIITRCFISQSLEKNGTKKLNKSKRVVEIETLIN